MQHNPTDNRVLERIPHQKYGVSRKRPTIVISMVTNKGMTLYARREMVLARVMRGHTLPPSPNSSAGLVGELVQP